MIQNLALSEISERCAQETEFYYLQKEYDPAYCLELFRRALIEEENDAWTLLYNQYESQVTWWVLKHPQFELCDEEPSYFVNGAFEKFREAMTPQTFAKCKTLGALTQYLKLCVGSIIMDYVRVSLRQVDVGELTWRGGSSPEKRVVAQAAVNEFWAEIESLLQDELEKLVIRCYFEWDLKAAAIMKRYPDKFSDKQEIYRIRERVFKRFRRNPNLKRFLN